jgi:hypothetical protein
LIRAGGVFGSRTGWRNGSGRHAAAAKPSASLNQTSPRLPERTGRYGGSIEALAAERDPVREEQLLQTLPVIERGLDPQISRARQNPLCKGQDALHVEFFDL